MPTMTDVFGGPQVNPGVTAFRAMTLLVDQTLVWPLQDSTVPDVVASLLIITSSAAGKTLTMPAANQWSNGPICIIANLSANSIDVDDGAGGPLVTIASGVYQYLYIKDNSTAAGVWGSYTFGTGTSQADANALAGLGLVVLLNKLNVQHPVVTKTLDYTILASDRASVLVWAGGAGNFTFDPTVDGMFVGVRNAGSGVLNIPVSSGTINGAASVALQPGEACFVFGNGTNAFTVGEGRPTTFPITRILIDVAGTGDYTESATEAANLIQEFTGTLTGARNVIVPTAPGIYFATNSTTGAFSLTIKTAAGTGVVLEQGKRIILTCDGTNVVNSTPWLTPMADLAMGGYKFLNCAAAAALDQFATLAQVQNASANYAADSGAANAYVAAFTPAVTSLVAGQRFLVKAANANTASSTVNPNGLGATAIKRFTPYGLYNLVGGEICASQMMDLSYDGTQFQLMNPAQNGIPGEIMAFGGATVPVGYVLAYGQAVSRTVVYDAVFARYSTTWGVGDGSTTFNLPDLRGRALIGKDDMGGAAANRVTNAISGIAATAVGSSGGSQSLTAHTHTGPSHTHDMGNHTHLVTDHIHSLGSAQSAGPTTAGAGGNSVAIQSGSTVTAGISGGAPQSGVPSTNTTSASGTGATSSTGSGASENMIPCAVVLWCIKL